jgi:hypothetical protein
MCKHKYLLTINNNINQTHPLSIMSISVFFYAHGEQGKMFFEIGDFVHICAIN